MTSINTKELIMTARQATNFSPEAIAESLSSSVHAYNAAFEELDLPWHWDANTYLRLIESGGCAVRRYLETERAHLLHVYDADFLVRAVETARKRCQSMLTA